MSGIWRSTCVVLGTILVAVSASCALAAPTGAPDFNHSTTGFPLTGGHATAVCETCHVGGVFKGTPRDCEGCHALGKRVVATPKSASHVVTDAPCDSCHFNTATFLGARYNHSLSRPESCTTCHNGRIAQGRPGNHNGGKKATDSCDHCHRTSAFLPSSWNHVGVAPGTCNSCHLSQEPPGMPPNHSTPVLYTIPSKYDGGRFQCDDCHSFVGWTIAAFKHNVAGTCDSCHTMKPGHISTNGAACSVCHKTRSGGWKPASFHSGNEAGICGTCHDGITAKGKNAIPLHIPTTGNNCDLCHTSTTSFASWTMNHAGISTCNACHESSSPAYPGIRTRKAIPGHENSRAGQDCRNCHNKGISWQD
jgi:hypothetical protein